MASQILSTLKSLPPSEGSQSPPPLESEAPHKRLARLNRELVQATETIQALKKQWAERNLKAQACRQAVSTAEVTHFENEKRDQAAKILRIQTEIGAANKLVRERSKNGGAPTSPASESAPRKRAKSKACPLKEHPSFDQYFRLAAENELENGLYDRLEAAAKSMLSHALATGIEQ
jgi:hypothetical protein